MSILYVETNFLVAIATGRDPRANAILLAPPAGFRLVIPDICVFEAINWQEGETKRQNTLENELRRRIGELKRDLLSQHALQYWTHLEDALRESDLLLKEVVARLDMAIAHVASHAELVPPTAAVIVSSRANPIITQPTDSLILHAILGHARASLDPTKALLTENHRDFGTPEARAAMRSAGIEPFRDTDKFLGWASGRSSPPGP